MFPKSKVDGSIVMSPVTTLEYYIVEQLTEAIDGFLEGLGDEWIVRWYPVQKLAKRGSEIISNAEEIKMYIRSAVDARRADLVLGIVITGDYVGTASGVHDFHTGDVIIDVDGKKYEVMESHRTAANTKWVLDLKRRDTEDAGEIM